MDVFHDLLQRGAEVFLVAVQTGGVLAHLQAGHADAAGVGGLARSVHDAGGQELADGVHIARHVRAFGDADAAVFQKLRRLGAVQLILRGAGQREVALHPPRARIRMEGRSGEVIRVGADPGAALLLVLLDPVDLLLAEAVRIVDEAAGVGHRHRLAAAMEDLLRRVGRHVAGAGDHRNLAFDRVGTVMQHVLKEIDRAVAGGFGPHQRAAIFKALAGQHAFEAVREPLVCAEHIADFLAADADVARRNVDIRADMAVKLRHEGLTEAHDFMLRLALRVKVGAALAAAHGQAGERVLEGLLEAEEFQDALVHRGMEPDAALVGANRVVELDAVAAVHLHLVVVVLPRHAERDDAVRLRHAVKNLDLFVDRVVVDERNNGLRHLMHSLVEDFLRRIAAFHPIHEITEIDRHGPLLNLPE